MANISLKTIQRLQAIAQSGLAYARDIYDIERFQELQQISYELLAQEAGLEIADIATAFCREEGYPTPKIDIRAVIFQSRQILMVRERTDGLWSLPGGWADVGYSPSKVAVKEVQEEACVTVKPIRLLGILDRSAHEHPPSLFYIYKIYIQCEMIEGQPKAGPEALDAGFFRLEDLPPLSITRVTQAQIEMLFQYLDNPGKPCFYD